LSKNSILINSLKKTRNIWGISSISLILTGFFLVGFSSKHNFRVGELLGKGFGTVFLVFGFLLFIKFLFLLIPEKSYIYRTINKNPSKLKKLFPSTSSLKSSMKMEGKKSTILIFEFEGGIKRMLICNMDNIPLIIELLKEKNPDLIITKDD
jgi:hypothetical protein